MSRRSSLSAPSGRRVSFDVPLPRVPSIVPLQQGLGLRLDHLWTTPANPASALLPDLLASSSPAVSISRALFAILAAIATFGAGLAYSTYFQAKPDARPLVLSLLAWSWASFVFCVVLSLVWQIVLASDFDDGAPGRGFRHKLVIFAVLIACLACLLSGTVLLSLALVPDAPGPGVQSAGYAVAGLIGVLTLASVLRFSCTVARRSSAAQYSYGPPSHIPMRWPRPDDVPARSPSMPRAHELRRVTIEEPLQHRATHSEPHLLDTLRADPAAPSASTILQEGDAGTRLTASPEPHVDEPSLLSDDAALRRFTLSYSRLAFPLLVVRRRFSQFDGLQPVHKVQLLAQAYKDMHRLSPVWYPVDGAPFDPDDESLVADFLRRMRKWETVLDAVWFDGFHQLPPNEMTRYMLAAQHGMSMTEREGGSRTQTI